MTNGILVAENGYAVETATDEHLILKTDFTLLKVKASGSIALNGYTPVTIAHNLGYKPQFLAYGKYASTGVVVYPHHGFNFSADGIFAYVDNNNLYLSGDPSVETAYYYIFYEQI